jgi:hypothetical protein
MTKELTDSDFVGLIIKKSHKCYLQTFTPEFLKNYAKYSIVSGGVSACAKAAADRLSLPPPPETKTGSETYLRTRLLFSLV